MEIKIGVDRFSYILRGKPIKAEEVKIVDEKLKEVVKNIHDTTNTDTNESFPNIVLPKDVTTIVVLKTHFNNGRWLKLRYTISD